MPVLVIVTDPNGSGKTTLVRSGILAELLLVPLESINADDIGRGLADGRQPTDSENFRAAQMVDALLDEAIAERWSATVETVLSSDEYGQRLTVAKANGFAIVLIYVSLRLPELNVARVGNRRTLGGHDVPEDRIRVRRARSHAQFAWFAERADQVIVFDNSVRPIVSATKGVGAGR